MQHQAQQQLFQTISPKSSFVLDIQKKYLSYEENSSYNRVSLALIGTYQQVYGLMQIEGIKLSQ